MELKEIEEFNRTINDSINKASKGLSNKIDVHLLTDLKRMSELGVLEIQQDQPEIKPFNESKNSISIEQKVRLYFKGEETIISQQKRIEELENELKLYTSILEGTEKGKTLKENKELKERNK